MSMKGVIGRLIREWAKYKNKNVDIDEIRLDEQAKIAEKVFYNNEPKLFILRAPTGFGKSEIFFSIFFYQFIQDSFFAGRMYVAEPVHALLNNISERAKIYRDALNLDVSVGEDHGEIIHPTFLYSAIVTLTTIDALAYGFLAKRVMTWVRNDVVTGRYTIPAGLIMNSFLVLDEAHLIQDQVFLGPRILSKIICSIVESGGIVLLSSATIPSKYLSYFNCNKEEITPSKIDKKVIIEKVNDLSQIEGGSIVFLNTIDRAREVYMELKNNKKYNVLLLHSLLRSEEKNKILKQLVDAEKNNQLDNYVLVSTQSAEVGIDFSFKQVYTEVAPIDSLIQRFGRVRQNIIKAYLIDTPSSLPYPEDLVKKTIDIISKHNEIEIGDAKEVTSLLDQVYDEDIVNKLSRQGDSFYISSLEYLDKLHLFSYPPDNDVYLRPSFYVTIYVITEKDEFEKIIEAINNKEDVENLLAGKSLKISISLINDYNRKRLDMLKDKINNKCKTWINKINNNILNCDDAMIYRGNEIILYTSSYYDKELGLMISDKEKESQETKGKKKSKKTGKGRRGSKK